MAYTINLTNGDILTTVADGTVNSTASSLTLIGKNYAGYGEFLNENYVYLLENFASQGNVTTGSPTVSRLQQPLIGQLWWDTLGNLKVYTGSTWRTIGTMTSSNSAPTGSVTGNAWWDSVNQQLNIYNGAGWTLIGPAFTANVGQSGTVVGTITDNATNSHVAVNVYVSNTLVAIVSKDSEYTPQSVITGFTTIKPGFNLTTAIANIGYFGNASNSLQLGGIDSTNYARTDVASTFQNTVLVNNNNGLTVGAANNFVTSVTGTTTQLINKLTGANLSLYSNVAGTLFESLTVDGSSGAVRIANLIPTGTFGLTGNLTVDYNGAFANPTSYNTGAIRVTNGGIGMLGNLFTSNSVVASGNVVVSGRVQATGNVTTASYLVVSGSEDASSNTTGAVRISGGMSLGGAIFAAGNVNALNFNGVSVRALYADLAERFEADAYYQPGTVLTMGGEKEVTLENAELSDEVFGVVSTRPAYLMNSAAGEADTHPPIAVSGRVPVRVVGKIKKGQRLVSAGAGMARAATKEEITPFNVIGRALENKLDDGVGTIYAIVKLNN